MSLPLKEEDLRTEEEIGPDQALTLRQIFGEKLLDFGSMEKMIRWISGLGLAQIIVAVLLMGLDVLDLPKIEVHGDGTQMAIPLIVACGLFLVMAWTYLLAGALHSRLLIRIPVIGIFLAIHIGMIGSGAVFTVVGWLSITMFVIYAIWHGRAKPSGYMRDLTVLGLGLLFFYLFVTEQAIIYDPKGHFVSLLIGLQISAVAILLIPLVMFAGLDLGESVRDLARWGIGQGAARANDRLLTWIAISLTVAKVVWLAWKGEASPAWISAGLFLLMAGYLAVRLKPWEGLDHEPPFSMLFWITLGQVGALVAGVIISMVAFGSRIAPEVLLDVALGLICAVSAVSALWLARTRRDTRGRSMVAYLAIFTTWVCVWLLTSPEIWNDWLGLGGKVAVGIRSLDGAAAVLLTVGLLYLASRGLATRSLTAWAIAFTVGLSAVRFVVWMAEGGLELPAAIAAGQLILIAVGILWDVLTSGDKWTNGDSPNLPRVARICLYFGYVALTVTALLYWKGSGKEEFFDPDKMALVGLSTLGIPLYLYGFARSGIMLFRQAALRQSK